MTEPVSPRPRRAGSSASSDATIAALVGVAFAMAMANRPLLWFFAVVTLLAAAAIYAIIRLGLRRHGRAPLGQSAQTAHGVRVLVLFVVAFLLTRVTPPESLRMAYAALSGVIVGVGGFVVLRLEAAALEREARGDRIDP